MKNTFLVFTTLIWMSSCNYLTKKQTASTLPVHLEKTIVEDGKGEEVEIKVFDGVGIDSNRLKALISRLSIEAKYECENTASYKPYKKTTFSIIEDSAKNGYSVIFNYLAANAFGAERELRTYWTLEKDFKVKEKFTIDL